MGQSPEADGPAAGGPVRSDEGLFMDFSYLSYSTRTGLLKAMYSRDKDICIAIDFLFLCGKIMGKIHPN